MRATQDLRRMRARRTLITFVATALLAVSAFAGTATAATPSWDMTVTPLPSQVKPGELAGYRVVITNTGTSNISQVFLTNALDTTDDPPVSADPYAILDTAYVSTSQGVCDPVGVRLDCTLGAIRKNKSATVVVAYATTPTAAQLLVVFEANTTGVAGDNPGSSHGDVLQGIGLTTTNPSDDFGGRFVTAGLEDVFNEQTLGTGNLQTTRVGAPALGIGVTVADGAPASDWCPTCTSQSSEVNVNNGATFSNGFKIEIQVSKDLVSGSISTVYHQLDNGNVEPITTACPKNGNPNASQMPCFKVKNLPGGHSLVTIWTKSNGKYGM
jgi:hypothetical protein